MEKFFSEIPTQGGENKPDPISRFIEAGALYGMDAKDLGTKRQIIESFEAGVKLGQGAKKIVGLSQELVELMILKKEEAELGN